MAKRCMHSIVESPVPDKRGYRNVGILSLGRARFQVPKILPFEKDAQNAGVSSLILRKNGERTGAIPFTPIASRTEYRTKHRHGLHSPRGT
jgi:hypothetical protein